MAKHYELTPNLMVGNDLIDTEHKHLFEVINDLLDACSEGKGRVQVEKTLQAVIDYTKKHFGDEENLQKSVGFKLYNEHKKLHDGFKCYLGDWMKYIAQEGISVRVVGEINNNVGGWLIEHITREDVKVAACVREQGR